jgi:hypothetical protein
VDGDLLQVASFSFHIRFQQTPPEQGLVGQGEGAASLRR